VIIIIEGVSRETRIHPAVSRETVAEAVGPRVYIRNAGSFRSYRSLRFRPYLLLSQPLPHPGVNRDFCEG